jgi:hypothetical protein
MKFRMKGKSNSNKECCWKLCIYLFSCNVICHGVHSVALTSHQVHKIWDGEDLTTSHYKRLCLCMMVNISETFFRITFSFLS